LIRKEHYKLCRIFDQSSWVIDPWADYRFYPYNIQDEGQKYAKVGISVKTANLDEETVFDVKLNLLSYALQKQELILRRTFSSCVVWKITPEPE
jgi:hypothetical protein